MASPVRSRLQVITAIATVALAAAGLAATASDVRAASSGLAYDEVLRFVQPSAPPPQPGTFAADFQAAVSAGKPANTQHHGFFSAISNVVNMAKNAANIIKVGTASSHYYLNGWERTDDPGAQTATIYRPDRKQTIYLNIAAKTYRIVDMTSTPMETEAPSTPTNPEAPPASPQPGSETIDVSDTSSVLGPKTIDDIATTGYSQDFKIVTSQSTGSCRDGTLESNQVQYLSTYAQPGAGTAKMNSMLTFHNPSPVMSSMRGGCQPKKVTMHHAGSAEPPGDKLALWSLITFKASAQSNQGNQTGGSFSTLVERGHVRVLGPGDAGLFDVPAGYTKEQ